MKINSIHINNFGKLKDYTINFESGFNIIYGNNEDGKSTIMSFIKMMFYGYSGKSSDLTKNLRKRYLPWDGVKMSGYIDFEDNGINYRIEKQFGGSNATDKVNLWNKTSGEKEKVSSSSDIGQRFFGIGSAAFEKSVFIGQLGNAAFSSTDKEDEITQKLLNLVSTGDESISQKKVETRLQSAKEKLKSKSGKIGIIDKQYQKLNELTEDRITALKIEENKKQLQEKCKEIEKDKDILEKEYLKFKLQYNVQLELTRLCSLEDILEKKDNIEKQAKEFERKRLELVDTDGAVIDENFIKDAEEQISQIQSQVHVYNERLRNLKLLEEESNKLKSGTNEGISAEFMDEIKNKEKEISEIKSNIEQLKDDFKMRFEYERLKALCVKSEKQLSEYEDEVNKQREALNNADIELEQNKNTLNEQKGNYENTKNKLSDISKKYEDANAEYQVALHNLNSVELISEQKIKLAEEQIRQAVPYENMQTEKSKRKVNKVLLTFGILLFVAAIILGVLINPVCYWAGAAGLLLGYLSLGKGKTSTQAEDAQNTQKQAMINIESVRNSANNEKENAEKSEREALKKLEDYRSEKETVQKSFEKLQELCQSLQEKFYKSQQRYKEAEINLKYINERFNTLKTEFEENKLQFNNMKEIEGDLNTINKNIHEKTAYESSLKEQIQKALSDFDCKTIDELQNKYVSFKNKQAVADSKKENMLKVKQEQSEAKADLEKTVIKFIKSVSRYKPVKSYKEAKNTIYIVKDKIEELNTYKVKIQSQLDYIKEEMKNRSIEEIKQEAETVRNKIKSDNNGIIPEKLDAEQLNELKHLNAEYFNKDKDAREEFIKMNAEIKNKFSGQKTVSEVENEIEQLKKEISESEEYYKCLDIAHLTFKEAFSEIRQSFGPLLNEKTALIFNKITGGKYDNVIISRNFDIHIQDSPNAVSHEWQYLSSGTIDQAYLALRLAVSSLLTGEGIRLPLLLDDVFTQYDDERTKEGLEFISNYSNDSNISQIIFFTCHNNIIELAKKYKLQVNINTVV